MEFPNAFVGKKKPPSPAEVDAALGACAPLWHSLIEALAERGVGYQEWKAPAQKYGWTLRLKRNKRTILFLSPCKGCFEAMLVLDDRAIDAVQASALPQSVLKQLAEAPYNIEGAALRLMVKTATDMEDVRQLVAVRLES